MAEGTVLAPLEALQEAAGPVPELSSADLVGSHLTAAEVLPLLEQLYSVYKV